MWDLFKAELQRFRFWCLAYASLHLLILGFLTRVVDLAQQPLLVYRSIAAVYALSGLLFGLYQLGNYRRSNTWLQLLHRPLPHWRIAVALAAASVLLLLIAVALPVLVIAIWQKTMTARVVDLRHWLLPVSAILIATSAYLAAGYAVLGGRRFAISGLILLGLLLASDAAGFGALLIQLLALLWLAALLMLAFKPDLSASPRSPLALIAVALPLQMAIYCALVMVCFGVELLWIMQGSHPNNSTPPAGGFVEANKAAPADLLSAGLAVSARSEAALWQEQIALSEVFQVFREFERLPQRHSLSNLSPMEFDDNERGERWVFSHDRMRFRGYRLSDGKGVGEMGATTANAEFTTPALPIGSLPGFAKDDALLMTANGLYQYQARSRTTLPRFQLPSAERFAATPSLVGESIAILSDRALYIVDGRSVSENEDLIAPRLSIPLPGAIGNLTRIDLIELVDGYLISFTYTSTAHNARVDPYQEIVQVHDDGATEPVARRVLAMDYPTWHRYELWWLSPAMHSLYQGATQLFVADSPLLRIDKPAVPLSMRWLAATLAVLSMSLVLLLSRGLVLTRSRRLAWAAAAALIGLPALISFWLLHGGKERG